MTTPRLITCKRPHEKSLKGFSWPNGVEDGESSASAGPGPPPPWWLGLTRIVSDKRVVGWALRQTWLYVLMGCLLAWSKCRLALTLMYADKAVRVNGEGRGGTRARRQWDS